MAKRIVSLLMVALLALTMVSSALAEDVTTIYVWSNDAHSKDVFVSAVEKFNAGIGKEKGIQIELSVYGTDYYSTLDIALNAGEAAHIFKCNKIPQYAAAGKIVSYESMPGGAELIAPYKSMLSEGASMVNGVAYTVPFKGTARGLAYNVDLFNSLGLSAPTTWAEMEEACRVITDNGNGLVYGYGLGMAYTSYYDNFIDAMAGTSVPHAAFNNETGRFEFTDFAPYFKHLLTIINDGCMFPGYETMDDDTKRAQFAEGNIGMIPVFSPDVGVLTTQFPAKCEWAVIPYPSETGEAKYKMPTGPSNFYVLNKRVVDEGVEEEAMVVLNYFLGDEHLTNLFEQEKDLITRGDLTAKSTATGGSAQWKQFGDASYRYIGFSSPSASLAIEGDGQKDVYDKILTGLVDVDEALADLEARFNAALDKAVADGLIKIEDYLVPNMTEIVTR